MSIDTTLYIAGAFSGGLGIGLLSATILHMRIQARMQRTLEDYASRVQQAVAVDQESRERTVGALAAISLADKAMADKAAAHGSDTLSQIRMPSVTCSSEHPAWGLVRVAAECFCRILQAASTQSGEHLKAEFSYGIDGKPVHCRLSPEQIMTSDELQKLIRQRQQIRECRDAP